MAIKSDLLRDIDALAEIMSGLNEDGLKRAAAIVCQSAREEKRFGPAAALVMLDMIEASIMRRRVCVH